MPSAFGPMTLGEIIDRMKEIHAAPTDAWLGNDGERSVYIDWNSLVPGGFHSYRGYYDHLSISFKSGYPPPKISAFIKALEGEVGAVHGGWKGGEFTMDRDTPVWIADTGTAPGWGVASIRDDGYCATLVTQHFD